MEKWGFGLNRKEILQIVGDYVAKNGIITPFQNEIPGEDWLLGFKKHHNLSITKRKSLEYARKKMTDSFVVSTYFDLLKSSFYELHLHLIQRTFGTSMRPVYVVIHQKPKWLVEKNSASNRIISGPVKDNTTILAACNEAGSKIPPLIFKSKFVWDQWVSPNGYPGTVHAAS
ncbi:hypothetical protein C0J52_23591 [Blattella germanica]|nr:hypothetical protein C0J52_23591 [Blattella germanica]